jgi:sporulation protein YlmC with PRC-barrel domain
MRIGSIPSRATELTMMIRLASAAAIAALMSTAAMAQTPNAPTTQPAPKAPMAQPVSGQVGPSTRLMTTMPADGTTVTNYYKQSVYDPSGNKVGDISDLIVEKDGRITTAMVGVGGFLGIDEKNVAIPFDALNVSQKNNQWHLMVNTTKDELKSAPGFKYNRDTTTWVSDKSASNAGHKGPLLVGTMPRE